MNVAALRLDRRRGPRLACHACGATDLARLDPAAPPAGLPALRKRSIGRTAVLALVAGIAAFALVADAATSDWSLPKLPVLWFGIIAVVFIPFLAAAAVRGYNARVTMEHLDRQARVFVCRRCGAVTERVR